MASQIRRRKVGNATITQNLTTGDVTHSVQFGDKLVKSTISKKVSNDGKTRHRTTTTRNHGPGIWSRTTKSRTQGGKNDSALGKAIWKGLFGSSSKQKKVASKPKVVIKPIPEPKKVEATVSTTTSQDDAGGFGAVIALGLMIWFGYAVIDFFKG